MIGGRGGDDTLDGADGDEDESFAELMGETRRIDPGPARVAPPARTPKPGARESNASRTLVFRWPDPKERGRAAASGVSDAQLLALGRGEPEPEERIDLHGTRREAGGRLVRKRLESARARGLRCVVIIHGRGLHSGGAETLLKDALPGWLTNSSTAEHVLAFAPAPARLGGAGATLVLLRRVL